MENKHLGVRAMKENWHLAPMPSSLRKDTYRKPDWRAFWKRYLENPSFQNLVNKSAKRALQRSGYPHTWSDDVRQEALLILSEYIQKRPDLGYESERGNFSAFIGSVVYRCCVKGVHQFRHTMHQNSLEEWQHPYCLPDGGIDKRIDLQAAIARVDEKSRSIVWEMLANKTVAEIAIARNCSPRTVYRDFQKAIALLQHQLID